jgi:outer membrane immunogenic protein
MRTSFTGILTGAALTSLAAAPAFAADMMLTKAPPLSTAAAPTWTGFYVGGNVGYGWVDPTATFTANPASYLGTIIGAGAPVTFDMVGALGGVQVGYNWQLNAQWLAGAEVDFDFAGFKGSGTSSNNTLIGVPFSSTADEHVNWFGTERLRFGYLPSNNVLLYGTGGVAQGGVKQSVSYVNGSPFGIFDADGDCALGPSGCYIGSSSRIATGWAAGGGLEYAFADHWSVRAEYLYINLGDNNFSESVAASNTPGVPASTISVHYSPTILQTLRVGMNYRF